MTETLVKKFNLFIYKKLKMYHFNVLKHVLLLYAKYNFHKNLRF